MKTRHLILAILLLVSANMVFAQGGKQYVKIKQENIRSSMNGPKIGTLNSGTQVEVLESTPEWTKVQLTCWIWKGSLTTDKSMVEGFQIRASHILCETKADAQAVLDRLNKGESFEALAKEKSIDRSSSMNGGDLGYFSRGDLLPEFDAVAFQLKVGQISGIISTPLGYHIIKRTE